MIVALIGASVVAYAIANRFRLIAPVLLIVAGEGVATPPAGGRGMGGAGSGPIQRPTPA